MLDAEQRSRYARHLLLVEVGEAGQERLCAALCGPGDGAHPDAWAVAEDYLKRAGACSGGGEPYVVALPNRVQLTALAGEAYLEPAAAALAGAFGAVEAVKAIVGVGQPASLPAGLCLAGSSRRSG